MQDAWACAWEMCCGCARAPIRAYTSVWVCGCVYLLACHTMSSPHWVVAYHSKSLSQGCQQPSFTLCVVSLQVLLLRVHWHVHPLHAINHQVNPFLHCGNLPCSIGAGLGLRLISACLVPPALPALSTLSQTSRAILYVGVALDAGYHKYAVESLAVVCVGTCACHTLQHCYSYPKKPLGFG